MRPGASDVCNSDIRRPRFECNTVVLVGDFGRGYRNVPIRAGEAGIKKKWGIKAYDEVDTSKPSVFLGTVRPASDAAVNVRPVYVIDVLFPVTTWKTFGAFLNLRLDTVTPDEAPVMVMSVGLP